MPPDWSSWASAGAGLSHTVEDLTNGRTHTFEVRAVNAVGKGPASNQASATPQACELSLSGPTSVDYAENGTGSVGTYTVTRSSACDPAATLSWSRVGTNPLDFRLQGSGSSRSLHFKTSPNHEEKDSYEVTVQVSAGSESASRPVTVTVEDVNEPGTVTISSDSPYVGDRVWATLTDPDGVEGPTWSWTSVGTGSRSPPTESDSYYHTVPASAFGRILQATVGYTDAHGPQSAVGTAGPVQRRPCSLSLSSGPTSVTYAENGTGSVGTYTATNCDGLTWSLSGTDDGAFELTGSGSSRTLAFDDPPNYEVKSSYAVIVEVASGSESDSRTVTVNVEDVNEPPVISGPASKSVPENTTPVATYTATDPEGHSVTWRMATGGGTFSIGGSSGVLAFKSAKDYEALSSYTFTGTIRATDSGSPEASSTQAVTATVTNVDEPGTVTLSSGSPYVGDQLTATLTDPDKGIRQPTWSWTSEGAGARSPFGAVVALHRARGRFRPDPEGVGRLHRQSWPRQEGLAHGLGAGPGAPAGPAARLRRRPGRRTGGPDLGPGRRQRSPDHWVWIPLSLGHRLLAVRLYVDLRP